MYTMNQPIKAAAIQCIWALGNSEYQASEWWVIGVRVGLSFVEGDDLQGFLNTQRHPVFIENGSKKRGVINCTLVVSTSILCSCQREHVKQVKISIH